MDETHLDSLLGYHLRRASAVMVADLGAVLAELDLTVLAASVLLTADVAGGRTQSDIGRILGIKRANMAPLAAELVEKGLLDRVMMDGRSHALLLTASGKRMVGQVMRRIAAHEAAFLPELSAAERAALVGVLARIWKGVA